MSDDRSTFLHRIDEGWVAADGTVGGRNYDEYVDDADIAATLRRRPDSIVALDLPHHTAEASAAGLDFTASLPLAATLLQSLKDTGRYAPTEADQGLYAYEMREADGHVVRALVGLVRSEEFSSSADEPGRILRNEDVFAAKVTERRSHIETLGHLLSPVLLIPGQEQQSYEDLLDALFAVLPPAPLVADTDERGVTHRLWPVDTDPAKIGQLLDRIVFLVADGNHRSLAAQLSGSPWCLVVVASAEGLRIEPYNRLLRLGDITAEELRARIDAIGVDLTAVSSPRTDGAADTGETDSAQPADHLYLGEGQWYRIGWPEATAQSDAADRLPHSLAERHLFGAALSLEPFAPQIQYVGGRDKVDYLVSEVDAGRATAALLLRAVTIEEFTAINAARSQMPRKSTWFMPKARAGLVIARTETA